MLERLARWLRALGVDVVSAPAEASDRELVRRAHDEGRVLLTRDRGEELAAGAAFLVRSGVPLDQLREVAARFGVAVRDDRLFSRCLLCNAPLDETAAGRRCPACGRDYWEGSHTRRMRATLERALGRERGDAPAP